MLLERIDIGGFIPGDLARVAQRHDANGAAYLSFQETDPRRPARWNVTLHAERIEAVEYWSGGSFETLATDFDAIERIMTSRYGTPSRTQPDDDAQRFVELLAEGLPCDRYWVLRTRAWAQPVRATLSLTKVWPADLELTIRIDKTT